VGDTSLYTNLLFMKWQQKQQRQTEYNETYTQTTVKHYKLEYGPVPNVMAALTNIGGALQI